MTLKEALIAQQNRCDFCLERRERPKPEDRVPMCWDCYTAAVANAKKAEGEQ